jgi:hypothetical protein
VLGQSIMVDRAYDRLLKRLFSQFENFGFVLKEMANFDAIELENLKSNPYCLHGPTVLFEDQKTGEKFYSCSATRDHKICSFHLKRSDLNKTQIDKWFNKYKKSELKRKKPDADLSDIKALPLKSRNYCRKCDKFLSADRDKLNCSQKNHQIIENIKKVQLTEPCRYLLCPITDDQANAVSVFGMI